MPDPETFMVLYPILSHDEREMEYRFVDKARNSLVAGRVMIRGYPATIFCSTDRKYIEDMMTRYFIAGQSRHLIKSSRLRIFYFTNHLR